MADAAEAGPRTAATRPVSVAGLPPGVVPAPAGRRFLAQLVDSGPVHAALVWAWWASRDAVGSGTLAALLGVAIAWTVLVWTMLASTAAGPGMRLARLQLVGLSDGRPVGPVRVAVRTLLLTLLRLSVVGLLVMLVRRAGQPRGQGWHDLAVNALVIRARPLVPRAAADGAGDASSDPSSVRSSRAEADPVGSMRDAGAEAGTPAPAAAPAAPATAGAATLPPPLTPPPGVTVPAAAVATGPDAAGRPAPTDRDLPPLAVPTPSPWFVVLDDGRSVSLDRPVLIGRNPFPRLDEAAELVSIADPGRTVSKTHLELGVRDGTPYVRDRGSTNGSMVTAPSGLATRCVAGRAVPLDDGSLVTFGDHFLRLRSESGQDRSR